MSSMLHAELLKNTDLVIAAYEQAYYARYSKAPLMNKKVGPEYFFIKELTHQVGLEKALKLVIQFVKMNDDWFLKRGHSLIALKDNLNKVDQALPKESTTPKYSRGPKLKMHTYCANPKCDVRTWREIYQDEVEKLYMGVLCEGCEYDTETRRAQNLDSEDNRTSHPSSIATQASG